MYFNNSKKINFSTFSYTLCGDVTLNFQCTLKQQLRLVERLKHSSFETVWNEPLLAKNEKTKPKIIISMGKRYCGNTNLLLLSCWPCYTLYIDIIGTYGFSTKLETTYFHLTSAYLTFPF